VVSISKGLILDALDGIYGSDGQQQVRNLLDQEIVQGVILELYAIAQGRKRRDLQQRTIISAPATTAPDTTLTSFVDQGEMHLSKMACLSVRQKEKTREDVCMTFFSLIFSIVDIGAGAIPWTSLLY
jgi:hypothetical protein